MGSGRPVMLRRAVSGLCQDHVWNWLDGSGRPAHGAEALAVVDVHAMVDPRGGRRGPAAVDTRPRALKNLHMQRGEGERKPKADLHPFDYDVICG